MSEAADVMAQHSAKLQNANSCQQLQVLHKNRAAWAGVARQDLATSLDSSLKRNTAFIKKARIGLNSENLPSLLTDIKVLSLEKYLSEVVSAVAEGIGKVKSASEIAAATEVVSSLHQRFAAQFTTVLAYHLVRALASPPTSYLMSLNVEQRDKDESARVIRQRTLIKVVTELWLLGVFRSIQDAIDGANLDSKKKRMDEALPIFCLRELISSDKDFVNISIATSFVKAFSSLLQPDASHPVVGPDATEKLRAIISKYYQELASHLRRQNDRLHREKDRVEESTVAHGSVPTARELIVADLQKSHDKQMTAIQILGEALGFEALVLRDSLDDITDDASMIRGVGGLRQDGETIHDSTLWEDEEQKRFYEVLLDLSQVVPSDMLREDKTSEVVAANTLVDASKSEDEIDPVYDDADLLEPEAVEPEIEAPTTTIGVKVHNLLVRLPEMTNRESIDNCAIEFCFLNSKASRNRLIKALLDINTARTDLLPYYARLIATLSRYLASIATTVVAHLHLECRRFTAGKGLKKDIPKRIFNIRYISELVKFAVVPTHIIFHCIKIILDNFTKFDVEVLASMLEHCGRYLLRSPTTSGRMENVLAIIMRKAQNTSGVERTLIENAFYYVNPPEHAGIPQFERPTLQLYIDKLLYADLSSKNHDHILKRLKKLNWNDQEIIHYLASVFSSPWRMNYSSIHLLAVLLMGLSKTHPDFMVQTIDSILEEIRLGLEENIFRENQSRIAAIKYLGELFNHRLIDSKIVLDILFSCQSFGTSDGRPAIGGTSHDPAHDFFRIRLILTLLETCSSAFSHGSLRNQVDLFLCYFQYYLKTKSELSKDVEYDVIRTLALLRPALRLCKTLEEAASELEEASSHFKNAKIDSIPEPDDSSSSDSTARPIDNEGSSVTDGASLHEADAGSDSEQDFVLLEKKREQDDLDKFAEEDLDREFNKMMNESLEPRKQETRKPLEIAMPRRSVANSTTTTNIVNVDGTMSEPVSDAKNASSGSNDSKQAVKFMFLSRKSKPRSLDLPSDSPLALNNAAHREAEEREKQTIRDLTLKYEVAQSREELEDGLSRAGVGVKYLPIMLAGQKGGTRSGSVFKMGAREPRPVK